MKMLLGEPTPVNEPTREILQKSDERIVTLMLRGYWVAAFKRGHFDRFLGKAVRRTQLTRRNAVTSFDLGGEVALTTEATFECNRQNALGCVAKHPSRAFKSSLDNILNWRA